MLYSSFRVLLEPGDGLAHGLPAWNNHYYVHLNDAVDIPIEGTPESRFLPTAESISEKIDKIRVLILNSPLNPTGTCFNREELGAICDVVLDENMKPYFRAAVGNYKTTMDAKYEFQKEQLNIEKIADLMNIHHNFLKNDLRITTPEIDDMIDIAKEFGSIGSKIVGSGGGGSIVCRRKERSASSKIVNEL